MKTKKRKAELGYIVPQMLADREVAYAYLRDCGVKNPRKSIGKLYWLLNHLRTYGHLQRFRYHQSKDFVAIDTMIVRNIFGNHKYYYAILTRLIIDGFVDPFIGVSGKASFSETLHQCKKYRLTPLINQQEWVRVKVLAKECTTTRKILQFVEQGMLPVDRKLYNLLTRFYMEEIPFFEHTTVANFMEENNEFMQAIRKKAESKKAHKPQKGKKRLPLQPLEERMKDGYSFYKDSYLRLKHGDWRYSCDKYGRRHTNLTNLPKLFRKYLYVLKEGKKRRLHTIDVANSQVLLLLTIIPAHLPSYQKFKEWTEPGLFYEKVAERLGVELTKENKNDIKQLYFTYIYGDPKEPYVSKFSPIYQIMQAEFPDIVAFVNKQKATSREGYKVTSHKMQKVESDIIIKTVCKELIKSGLLFTQVYDSIMCLKEDMELVKGVMRSAFQARGLNVTLNDD